MRAARPVLFCLAGSEPLKWWDHRNSAITTSSIGGETENYQERIEINDDVLKSNAKRLSRGVNIALASPFIALATWTANWLPAFRGHQPNPFASAAIGESHARRNCRTLLVLWQDKAAPGCGRE